MQDQSYPFQLDELKQMAITDELTGLYNRRYFHFRMKAEMERSRRSKRQLAVLLLDLDGFKSVNDTYGHPRGDQLLIDFAELLSSYVRPFDLVARYAGDEFIIMLPESGVDEASKFAERIRKSISEHLFYGKPNLKTSTSIGISVYPIDNEDIDLLISLADKGLYTAKRNGKNRVARVTDQSMSDDKKQLNKTRLIGRDEELFLLNQELNKTLDGRTGGLFITGEMGTGKSRLITEMQFRAQQAGAITLLETCSEHNRFFPYLPIRGWLRNFFKNNSQTAYQSIRKLNKMQRVEMIHLLPGLDPGQLDITDVSLRSSEEEYQLFDAVTQYFIKLSELTAVVVFLDDIQWLDEASTKLLIYLLKTAQNHRILLVGSFLKGDPSDTGSGKNAFRSWLRGFREATDIRTIEIYRFNRDHTGEFVQALLGQKFSDHFVNLIHSESEGTPFFIEELLKSLMEKKILHWTDEQWHVHKINHLKAPDSIREMIFSSLDRLDEEDRDIVTMAAVIGRIFEFDTLLYVSGRNEGHLLDILERLESLQLINQLPSQHGEKYQFKHNKIREVLCEQLDSRRNKKLHRKIAYALAGDKANMLHAEASALRYYVRAIKLINQNPQKYSEELSVLHQKTGLILKNQGRSVQAIREFQQAMRIGKSSMTQLRRAQIHRWMAQILIDMGKFDEASKNIQRAENYLDPDQDEIELMRLETCLASLLLQRGEYEACLEVAQKHVDALKNTQFKIELSDLYDLMAKVEFNLGHRDQAVRLYSDSLKLRIHEKDMSRISQSYTNLADVFMEAGRWDDAQDWYIKCIETEEKLGHFASLAHPYFKLAKISLLKNSLTEADKYCQQAIEIKEMSQDIPGIAVCYTLMTEIFIKRNDFQEAQKYLDKAEKLHARFDIGVAGRQVVSAKAKLELSKGNLNDAFEIANDILRINRLFGDPPGNAMAYMLLANIEKARKNFPVAMGYYKDAEECYSTLGNRYNLAICLKEKGILSKLQGNYLASYQYLSSAKKIFSKIGADNELIEITEMLENPE